MTDLLYPPFLRLLRIAGVQPTAGTLTYDEATTAFLHDTGERPGRGPQCFGIGVVADKGGDGLIVTGNVVSLDLCGRTSLPAIRVIFERRGRQDLRAGLEDVFSDLNQRGPWGTT